ncbi:MAG: hypothetical protein RLZ98_1808 [Pseudomonadota bacterium]|jgi:GDP-L-fucose synthase
MTRALVTGGAGFVGRHLVQHLLADGIDVVCVDNLDALGSGMPPGSWPLFDPTTHRGFSFVEEDCRSYFARVQDRFELVFHLAAVIGGRGVIEGRPFAVAQNLAIDADFWKWAAATRCGLVAYMSSSAAYPVALQREGSHVPLSEDMIDLDRQMGIPDMTYGWSKLSGEYLMRFYTSKLGGRAVAFRPFSGYGEDQSLDYPFPSICRRVLAQHGAERIEVWGSGRQERDFIHIDDCIAAILAGCQALQSGGSVNLSSGTPTSFIALTRLAANIAGYDPVVEGRPDMPEGVFSRVGDRTLQESLGLTPKISLEEGLQRCIAYQQHLLRRELEGCTSVVPA